MAEADKTSWIYCNVCKGSTQHVLVASKEYDGHLRVGSGDLAEWGEYRLWACAGCDTCTIEDHYQADYLPSSQIESILHPKRTSSSRLTKHFVNLPAKLENLYSEVVQSNNEGLHLLCAGGWPSLSRHF
jgi:hypothetical protein